MRFSFRNQTDGVSSKNEILIYDDIGQFGFLGEVTALDVKNQLDQMAVAGAPPVDIRISSEGGSVKEGLAIITAIKNYPGKTTAYVDGFAFSMASGIAVSADETVVSEHSLMMLHKPEDMSHGNAHDLQRKVSALNAVEEALTVSYRNKTGMSTDEIKDLMADVTWLTAQQAVDMGFADRIDSVSPSTSIANYASVVKLTKSEHIPVKYAGVLSSLCNQLRGDSMDPFSTPQNQNPFLVQQSQPNTTPVQPVNHAVGQPVAPPAPVQPVNHAVGQPAPPAPVQPVNHAVGQPAPPAPVQPVNHSVGQPVAPPAPVQPVNHTVGQPAPPVAPVQPVNHTVGQPAPPVAPVQPVNQAVPQQTPATLAEIQGLPGVANLGSDFIVNQLNAGFSVAQVQNNINTELQYLLQRVTTPGVQPLATSNHGTGEPQQMSIPQLTKDQCRDAITQELRNRASVGGFLNQKGGFDSALALADIRVKRPELFAQEPPRCM